MINKQYLKFLTRQNSLLVLLLFIGTVLRFYNLNWGSPYYFHPDERNIASAISRLRFPDQLNPQFFAYGSLPIYLTAIISFFVSFVSECHFSLVICSAKFEDAIFIGRIFSATLSLLLIPLLFHIGKTRHCNSTGIIAAFLATFSVGFIQFSHFSTFEIWSAFFTLVLLLTSLNLAMHFKKRWIFISAVISGILIAIKISNAVYLAIPIAIITLSSISKIKQQFFYTLITRFAMTVSFITIAFLVFIITNPYTLLAYNEFYSSLSYESGVALGTLPVFYTGEFFNTVPFLFQLQKVFPFLINPVMTFLAFPSLIYTMYLGIAQNRHRAFCLILLSFFLVSLVSSGVLFVKWTRYMVPTLPFIYLILALFLERLIKKPTRAFLRYSILLIVCVSSIVFGFSYWITAFVKPDTRINAAQNLKMRIAADAPILSESYDMGIVAFNEHFPHIKLFNFYELDNNSFEYNETALAQALRTNDYIILPSQRGLATRLMHKTNFPNGYQFYKMLTQDTKRFTKIYETPCDIFCKITYLNDQIYRFEGTANGFDRPPVMIYRINHAEE